jgi:hypothetical protein
VSTWILPIAHTRPFRLPPAVFAPRHGFDAFLSQIPLLAKLVGFGLVAFCFPACPGGFAGYEFMFRMLDRQDRAGGQADNLLGN